MKQTAFATVGTACRAVPEPAGGHCRVGQVPPGRRDLPKTRRGTVLVAALVCLAIVLGVVGQMLVGAMRASRQMRVERDRRQCELLLQAGLDRAALSVADGDYTGEAWDVAADEIGGSGQARVTIRVSREDDAPEIHVLAEYPVGSERSIRRSRTVQLQR